MADQRQAAPSAKPNPLLNRHYKCGDQCECTMGVVFEPYQSRNVIGESRGRRPSSARSLGTSHTRAGGHPLDASVSSLMSGAFGHDFSRVRIHADDAAARRVDSLHAEAVTIDSNIFFGSGFYQPGTIQGRRLIAHELTPVT